MSAPIIRVLLETQVHEYLWRYVRFGPKTFNIADDSDDRLESLLDHRRLEWWYQKFEPCLLTSAAVSTRVT